MSNKSNGMLLLWSATLAVLLLVVASTGAQETVSNVTAPAETYCYVCNENVNASCADVGSASGFVQKCGTNETFCRKIVQEIEGKNTVIRQCAKSLYKENEEYVCYKLANGKTTQTVCECRGSTNQDQSPCNESSRPTATLTTIATVLLLLAAAFLAA